MKAFNSNSLAVIGVAIAISLLAFAGTTSTNAAPVGSSPAANKVCGNGTFNGEYGFSYSGTIDGLGSITGIGSETCDGNGNCVGTGTASINGAASSSAFTSVYTINPDCTGIATTTFPDGLVLHSAIVLLNDGDEIHFIGTDPGSSYIGVEKRR